MNVVAGPFTKEELNDLGIFPENNLNEYFLIYLFNYPNKSLLYMTYNSLLEFILETNKKFVLVTKNQMKKLIDALYESIEKGEYRYES